jgi:hypothetical protein
MEETPVSTEQEQPQAEIETVKPKEDPRAFLIPFVKQLRTLVPKADLERFFWISKSGLFVKEEFVDSLHETFKKWFFDSHQVTLDDEKVERKLFEDNKPTEKYLVLGSSVVVGFVCPCSTNELRGAGVRLYEGIPLDAANTLHHTDPIFSKSDLLSIKMSRQGFTIVVKTKRKELHFDFDTATRLRNFFKATGEQRKYIRVKTLRGFVESFAQSLQYAKPLPSNHMMMLPVYYASHFRGTFLQLGTVVVVENQDGDFSRISDCFGIEGRGYEHLVREELNLLAEQSDRRRLAGASLSLTKGSFLAHYDIMGIHHTFGVSAVFSFLKCIDDYYREHNKLFGRIRPRSTLREIIPEITGLLKDAAPCLPEKIPAVVKDEFTNIGTILTARGEWFFAVDRGHMIREITYLPKKQPKVLELKILEKS